jgi:hypothetical protein
LRRLHGDPKAARDRNMFGESQIEQYFACRKCAFSSIWRIDIAAYGASRRSAG